MNEYIGLGLISIGLIYDILACFGLVRMPDIYTRLQTSTKAVTIGTSCILIGAAVYAGPGTLAAKSLLCMVFVLLTNPTSAHVIARAAHNSGIRVERVTADGLMGREIESELQDITRKKDEHHKDKIIKIVETCSIIEINHHVNKEGLFELVSQQLGYKQNISPDLIKSKLMDREKEAVTALKPDFAIPHIIIEGEGSFELIAVRAKEGVFFSEDFPSVRSVFVMSGTQDQWNFYLKILALIVQLVRTEGFFDKWLEASGKEELRKLILNGVLEIRERIN